MTIIMLMRHGETEANVNRILSGRTHPTRLTDKGRAQTVEAANLLREVKPSMIYTSPIPRALETAMILSEALGVPYEVAEEFTEIDGGSLTGRRVEDVYREDSRWAVKFYSGGGGEWGMESFFEVRRRVWTGLSRIERRHPEGRVVVVTHVDPIKSVLAELLSLNPEVLASLRVKNAAFTVVYMSGGVGRLIAFNTTSLKSLVDDVV